MAATRATPHPLLRELHLVDEGETKQSPKDVSASDILTYLLQKKHVSEEIVRTAHSELLQQQKQKQEQQQQPDQEEQQKQAEKEEQEQEQVQQKPARNGHANRSPKKASKQKHKGDEPVVSYRRRHIALRFCYDGANYSGLAETVGEEKDNSVEKALFAALLKARLVDCRKTCSYSRCGRTDRGVSAAGQVVALQLKSAFSPDASWDEQGTSVVETSDLPNNSVEKISVWVYPRKKKPDTARQNKVLSEYAYDKILNNLLPDDIRVIGYAPVSNDFSARFSATTRTYRYFFLSRFMNLSKIQEGLDRMVGTFDFRNLCKINVEQVYNFERTIHSARVVVVDNTINTTSSSNDSEKSTGSGDVCYLMIVGQAFLWHQIRCIASVLFLIGRGLEEPSVVTELLDVKKLPGKPSYALAPERPLVLHDCGYKGLEIGCSVQNLWSLLCHQERQWEQLILAAARLRSCMNSLDEQQVLVQDVVSFLHAKLTERLKKQGRNGADRQEFELPSAPSTAKLMGWRDAMTWMEGFGVSLDPEYQTFAGHVPLLERSKGTTYEEKLEALSGKRRQRYEDNVIKKRKTKEEDAAFYAHKTSQGGSAVSRK